MKYISREALVTALKAEEEAAFKAVYHESYRAVEHYIKANGGYAVDAKDIFNDGLIALVQLVRKPDFKLTAGITSLMYGICRRIWLKSFRKKGKEITVPAFHQELELTSSIEIEMDEDQDEHYQDVIKALEQIGEQCKEIILLAHYQDTPRAEIAEQMGYTKAFVRIKLFRCMNKLRTILGISQAIKIS